MPRIVPNHVAIRILLLSVVLAMLAAPAAADGAPLGIATGGGIDGPAASEDEGPPLPDPAFAHRDVPGKPCTVENDYEARIYGLEVGDVRYPGLCKRIQFAFGPILVKPGENDALLEPVTIEKPAYDGYVVRFKPDLRRAVDGSAPNTENMHLHHATWLSAYPQYGNGLPFFAAGEEKTIATFPEGYGMPVGARDTWLLLYMVHNDRADTDVVWLTYDIDYIAASDVDDLEVEMAHIKPIWLDVQRTAIHPDAPSTSANPVFNVQRGFGGIDEETGRQICTWPKENCARHDTYGGVSPQQGQTEEADGTPIEIPGADWRVPASFAGNLIGLGGHLHFGGIRNEVSLVRDGEEKPIFISDALYWDWERRDEQRVGAPPWSWDFSMTVTGAPDWKVAIKEGDIVRLNAIVDSDDASWYEGMGIVVAYVAPDDPHGPEAVDVFEDDVILDRGYFDRALIPDGPWDVKRSWTPEPCTADLTGEHNGGTKRLCLRGMPTHGPLAESGNHAPPCPEEGCPPISEEEGELTSDIFSVGFTYGQAELGAVNALGLPLLKKGEPARLWNFDSAARVWHTFTRCEYPCTGAKNMWYPMADGGSGDPDDVMDFDSNEIGYGTMFEPAAGQIPSSSGKSVDQIVRDGLYWEFTPEEEGTYTFFCRIHRGMRGAFKVVE
jgi:hypothetical protein